MLHSASLNPPLFSLQGLVRLVPGLAIAGALAACGFAVQALTGSVMLSPMVVAMLIGIAIRNGIGVAPVFKPGLKIALKPLLRFGIVLLGVRLTFEQLGAVGLSGFAIVAGTLAATFIFTVTLGKLMGLDHRLSELIAAGTSVCGASAVLAASTVNRGSDEDVAYSIACVTLFGSISMLTYPLFAGLLGLSPETYGLWVGASIHEVAQVVGAGFALGDTAGEAATVAKLIRVLLLAPLIFALAGMARRRDGAGEARPPMPWFVFGFLLVVALNSAIEIPEQILAPIRLASAVMLTMALGAMGLETDLRKLKVEGFKPLALGAAAWIFISGLSLALI